MISKKYSRFLDEYLIDLNASAAAVRSGYAGASARQTAYKILHKPEVKAELERRFQASRMSSDEIIARLEAMAMGELPTKTVELPSREWGKSTYKREYDIQGATEKLGKVHALFVDKQIVENIGLEIIDDDEKSED